MELKLPNIAQKDKNLIPISEAAEFLGVSIDTVRRWDKAGKITATRPNGKDRYFSLTELQRVKFSKPLSITQAAEKLGLSVSTLRRLEQKGIITPKRDANGVRLYDESVLEDFISSDYYMSKRKVESKILSSMRDEKKPTPAPVVPAVVKPQSTVKTVNDISKQTPVTSEEYQRVVDHVLHEQQRALNRIKKAKSMVISSAVFVATTFVMLVSLITLFFLLFPLETAEFFGYDHSIDVYSYKGGGFGYSANFSDDRSNVLGASVSDKPEAHPVGRSLKPFSSVSLGLVRRIDEDTYRKIVPDRAIEDINDVFAVNEEGDLVVLYDIKFPDYITLDIEDPSSLDIDNIDAISVQGRKPGSTPGDLAVFGTNGTITGLTTTTGLATAFTLEDGDIVGGVGGVVLDGSLTGADIADGAITVDQLASGAVTGDIILDETIEEDDLADDAVTSDKIDDGTIVGADISDNTLTASDLASTLTFGNGDFIDLSAIDHLTTTPQGLLLPNVASASPSSPSSGEGYLSYDTSGDQVLVYNGSSWVQVGSGDITGVAAGTGLTDGGTSGDVTVNVAVGNGLSVAADEVNLDVTTSGTTSTTFSNSGLETAADGLSLLRGCADNQIIKWDSGTGRWQCEADSGAGGGSLDIEEGDSLAVSAASILDFLASDFTVSESPVGEGNVSIDYTNSKIVRSDQAEAITGGWAFNTATTTFGAAIDINGNVSIADTDIALDGASTNFTSTGDLSFNSDDIFIDKVTGRIGIGTTGPADELHVLGSVYTTGGINIGSNSTNTLIDDASNGAASATLYIGNETILASGDIGVSVQAYNANTTLLGSSINLGTETTGTLTVGKGGSGAGSFTSNGIIYGNGTGALQATSAGSNGYILYSNSGSPDWLDPTTLNAGQIDGFEGSDFLRSNASDEFTAGNTLTVSGTLDSNGDVAFADTSIVFDGASTNFDVTGDLTVNGNDLFVEKSSGYVGIGNTNPAYELDVTGAVNTSSFYIGGNQVTSTAAELNLLDGRTGTLLDTNNVTTQLSAWDQNASDDLTTATSFSGDVTGTYGATVVGDDSHSHTSTTLPAATSFLGSTISKDELVDSGTLAFDWDDAEIEDNLSLETISGTPVVSNGLRFGTDSTNNLIDDATNGAASATLYIGNESILASGDIGVTVQGYNANTTQLGSTISKDELENSGALSFDWADSEIANSLTISGGSISTSSIALVQSATPTPTTEGVIEWDTDNDRIVVGDGAGGQIEFYAGAHTVDTNTQLSEAQVEGYVFDGDNTGTLSSGTLALDSLSYTGTLDDTNVNDALTLETVSGTPVISNGVRIGTDTTNSLIDDASNGAASNTLYIGNESILASGDLGVSVQGYDADTSLIGQTIETGEITNDTILEEDLDLTNSPTDDFILTYDLSSGGFTWVDPSTIGGGTVDGSGTANYLSYWTDSDTLAASSIYETGGSIGIGTTDPSAAFEVATTARFTGSVNEAAQSEDRIDIGVQAGTPRMVFEDSGNTIWEIDNSGGVFRWYTPGIERLTLDATGNLDLKTGGLNIGTTNVLTSGRAAQNLTGITSSGTITFSGVGAGTDNSVVVLNGSNQLVTDEIDSRVWGSTLLDNTDIGSTVQGYDANTTVLGSAIDKDELNNSGILAFDWVDAEVADNLSLETVGGTPVITNGLRVGTDDTDHLIDEASNGAGSATLYIGNESILASGDIGVSVQGYNANTTILGSTISKDELENAGSLGFDWGDSEIADTLSLETISGTPVATNGLSIGTDTTNFLIDDVSNGAGSSTLYIGNESILASGDIGVSVQGYNANTTTLGSSISLTTEVTGTLPVGNGGTGATTFASNGILYGNGTSAIQATAQGSNGYILYSNSGTPDWLDPTSINAGQVDGIEGADLLRANASDEFTAGNTLTLSGTLDSNGDVSIADTNIAFDGATSNFSVTGDFSINGDDIFVEKSSGFLGVGTTNPAVAVDVVGAIASTGNIDTAGTLQAGSSNITLTNATGYVLHDSLVDCSDGEILKWSTGGSRWGCGSDATGGGSGSLDDAYNTSTATVIVDAYDLLLELNNATNDFGFVVDNTTSGAIDTAFEVTTSGSGGTFATAIDLTDGGITNAISVGTNKILGTTGDIDFTNFDVAGSTGNITTAGDIAVNGGDITTTAADLILAVNGASTGDVHIGSTTATTTPDLLILDRKTDAGNPTGQNGALFVNSSNKLMINENGVWKELCNKTDAACGAGSGSAWSALSAPAANLALTHAEYTTSFTWDTNATAAALDAFTLSLTNDASTDSNTQRVAVIQNNNASGSTATENLLVLNNADTDEAVTKALEVTSAAGGVTTALDVSDADITTAIDIGTNDIVTGAATIASTELDLLDSGIALSELTDSGTLTATTVDINGGNIDGTAIGVASTSSGVFTALTSTGATALGDNSSTVAINSSDWDITADGNASGLGTITADGIITFSSLGSSSTEDTIVVLNASNQLEQREYSDFLSDNNVIDGGGTANYISLWTDGNTLSDSVIYESGGSIGIGTTNPTDTLHVVGPILGTGGLHIGGDTTNSLIDDATNGSGSTTLYIGNESILASGDIGVSVQGYDANTTILGATIEKDELNNSGTLGFDWDDSEIADTLSLETISGTPVITNGVSIGTDTTDYLIDDATNGASSATLYIGNESILASGDIGASVQGYDANTTVLGSTIGNSELDDDTVDFDKIANSMTLDEETTIAAAGALNLLIGNNVTLTTTGSGAITATDLSCTDCIGSTEISDLTLGTDTAGSYVESFTAGAGLTGDASGEGSTPTLAVGAGTGITVNANDVAVNLDNSFAWTADHTWTLTDTEDLAVNVSITGSNSGQGEIVTLTNSSSSGNQYGVVVDNASSTGTTEALLRLDNSDTDTAVTNGIQFVDAGGGFTNLFDVAGTAISTSEFTLLDSGIALSELTDSGTLTATTVDINGGNIDGTAIGSASPSSGAFTTLSSTGVTTIGNDSATVAIDSSDWNITATGDTTGLGAVTADGTITFSSLGSSSTEDTIVVLNASNQLEQREYSDFLSDNGVIDGSGTANYLPLFSDANTLTDSVVYETGGAIGIGTTNPTDTLHVAGNIYTTTGIHVGADTTNNLIDDATSGSGSSTLYIGNESILASGDIGVSIQSYNANTTILGSTIEKDELNNSGTLGFDWVDSEIADDLSLETVSGTPVISNGLRIGTDNTNYLIDDATNGAGSATLYIGNESILASGDIGVSVQGYDANTTILGSTIGNSELDDDTVDFDKIANSMTLDEETTIAAGSALNLLIGNNVTLTTTGTGAITATDLSCTNCIGATEISDLTLGTDTAGDYVASFTAGNGLTGDASGEGSTPTLAVGSGTGISVGANDISVDQDVSFAWTADHTWTLTDTEDLAINVSITGSNSGQGEVVTITNTSSSGNQYGVVIDNAASTGTTESLLRLDNSDTDTAVTNGIDFVDAGGGFTNLFNVAGTAISTSEFTLLDSGVALSELTDSGTLTATTVDINGGNIDGTAIGSASPSSGAFTTLSSTGVTTIGNDSATVAIDSSDWNITATGDTTGLGAVTADGTITFSSLGSSSTEDTIVVLNASNQLEQREYSDFLSDNGVIDGSGTANYLPLFSDANTLTDSVVYETGGSIGIGTTAPSDTLHVVGNVYTTTGIHVGADTTNNLIDDATNGSGSSTLYIGNESILASGDIGVSIQSYDANTTILGSTIEKDELNNSGTLGFDWVDSEIADDLSLETVSGTPVISNGLRIGTDNTNYLIDDATNGAGSSTLYIGNESILASGDIGVSVQGYDANTTILGSTIGNSELDDDTVDFDKIANSMTLDEETTIAAGSALNLLIGNNVTLTTTGSGAITATDLSCTNCIGATEISDLTLGTDTAGDYVASFTAGNGLTGDASGEGSTPTLAVGSGTGISVAADAVAVDQDTSFAWTADHTWTLAETEDLAVNLSISGTNSGQGELVTVTNSSSSGNQYGIVVDNAASSGTTESLLRLDNSDTDTAVTNGIQFVDAGGGFTNLFDVAGTAISTSEFTLLDSGIALSELTDSGTLTATTVDINGGNIDGTAIGSASPSSGAFTTLSSTGVTTIGNDSATVAIDSSDWNITATGDTTGLGAVTADGTITFSSLGSSSTEDTIVVLNASNQLEQREYSDFLSDNGVIDGSGTANYLPLFSDANTLTDSVVYETGGAIGIGTTNPTDTLHVAGNIYTTTGIHVGADTTNNLIDDATNGSGSSTLYIGNESILASGDIGVSIQSYNANTTILGATIEKDELNNSGTLGFDWVDSEIADDLSLETVSGTPVISNGLRIGTDNTNYLIDDATNGAGSSTLYIGNESILASGDIGVSVQGYDANTTVLGSTIGNSELDDDTVDFDKIANSLTLDEETTIAAGSALNLLIGNNVTFTTTGSGAITATDLSCTNCIGATEISDLTLGTDTAGDYVASFTAGNGLTGDASGEGSTPTLAVGSGTGISVAADAVAVDQDTSFAWTADHTWTLAETEDLAIDISISGTNSGRGEIITLTNSSSSGSQYGLIVDNAASTGTTEALIALDNSDTDTAVTNGIQFIDAGGGFTNLFNVAGTLISTSEFTILDGGVANSELTDSGTLTAGTVDINGGNIDGTTIGAASAAAGTFTQATITTGALAVNGDSITSDGATLTINAGGAVDIQDSVTVDSLTIDTGNLDVAGTIEAGSGNITLTDSTGYVLHDALVDCADGQVLKWATGGGRWGCGTDQSGGGAGSLDDSYNNGATVTVDAYDILFDLDDATNDYGIVIDNNTTGAIATALEFTTAGAGGTFATAIDASDGGITTALSVGTAAITGTTGNIDYTNFDVVGSSGNITTAGTLAVNGDAITADGATLTINAGGAVDVQDALTADSLVLDTGGLDVQSGTVDAAITLSSTTSDNLGQFTLTNSTSSGTQNVGYFDNAASSGTTESILVLDNSDTDTAVTNGIEFVDAGGGFTNLFNVAGTAISSSEFTILDSGIALSELTDSGTLTATTVDINGGNIDGTAIGSASPSSGAFTTLSSTGVTTIGNDSATVAIDSSDWNITATGDTTGLGAVTADGTITFSSLGSSSTEDTIVVLNASNQLEQREYSDFLSDNGVIDGSGTANYLPVFSDGNTLTDSVVYETGGAIGIGTTNPGYNLEVAGTGYFGGNLSISDKLSLSTGGVITGSTSGPSTQYVIGPLGFSYNEGGRPDTDFRIESDTNQYMFFLDSGTNMVGIGTSVPTDTLHVVGNVYTTTGVHVGADNSNNLIDDATNGSGSTTLYIGNESILASGDIGVSVQGYDANTTILGATIEKNELNNSGTLGFDWDDSEVADNLSLETVSGTPVISNGVSIGTDTTNYLIDDATNGAGSATLYIGNESILASGDIGVSVQGYDANTTVLGSTIGNSELDDDTVDFDKIANSMTLDEETTIAAGGALNLLIGNNVSFTTTGTGTIVATDLSCTNCIGATEISDLTLGTDTAGDYVASFTAGNGLTGDASGEGSTPTLAVGSGTGISVAADAVAVDQDTSFVWTADHTWTLAETEDLAVNVSISGTNSGQGEIVTLTNSSASGNQYGIVVDNAASSGTTESLLRLDNSDTDTAVTNGIEFVDAGGTFTNFLNTPSIDISGAGAITGATGVSTTTVTASSAIAANGGITFDASTDTVGAFTAAGIIDMADYEIVNIGAAGTDFSGTGGLTLADNLTVTTGGITLTAGALAVNSDSITSDGTLVINASGNVDVQDTLNADALTSDAGVSIAAGSSYTGAGAVTLSSAAGTALTVDSGTTGTVNLGTSNNAKIINFGTGTAGNTLNIGTDNTTSDDINIGSALDQVSIVGDDWNVTDAGVLTVASCTGCGGGGGSLDTAYNSGGSITVDAYDVLFDLNDATNDYGFVIDNNTTGAIATAMEFTTAGAGGTFATAIDASDDGITTALSVGGNNISGAGYQILSTASGLTIDSTSADLALSTTTSGNITATPSGASALFNVLTGNLKVGNGTPNLPLDGEDAYIEGTLEVDGALNSGGVFTSVSTAIFESDLNFDLDSSENLALTTDSTAHTVDLFVVDTSADGTVTDGVDGISINLVTASDAAADTNAAFHAILTDSGDAGDIIAGLQVSGGTVAAGTQFGVMIDNITGGAGTETAIDIGTGWDTGISVGSGGVTIDSGALAVNSDSITSDGATLTINAAGNVDVQDALNADSITSDAGVSIAAGSSYTGAGAVTLSSTTTNALTVDSGTTGTVNLGTGNNAKIVNFGTGTAGNTLNIGTDNTTSDDINIGSALDQVSITGDDWSITDAGVLTVASCTGCGGGGGTLDAAYNAGTATVVVDAYDMLFELNDATNDYGMVLDNTTTGDIANALQITTTGAGGTFATGIDLTDAGLTTALNVGDNTITGAGYTIEASSGGLSMNATGDNLDLTTTTSGNILFTPAQATGLVNLITGNLKVGDGTPGVALNGEDAYIEGTLEVDSAVTFDSGLTITSGALAVNSDSITADGATLTINAGGAVDIQDALSVAGGLSGVTTLASSDDWTWSATTPAITINSTETFTVSDGTDTFTVNTSGSLFSFSDGTNSFTFDVDSGPSYAGTARPSKNIVLSPEYNGAVLTAYYGAGTDTSITGTMTSDADTTQGTSIRTYYSWERGASTQHFYTVAVRVTLPPDFSAWATTNALQVEYITENATSTNSDVDVRVYNENSATIVASDLDNASVSWATATIDDSVLDDGAGSEWDAAGETAVIYLRMGSQSGNYARIGDITLNYLAAY